MKLIGLCGSLRASSANLQLLHEARVEACPGLGELPHFNADLEGDPPASVIAFRTRVAAAEGVLISTPEYAHSVPGFLKNALDWLVSSGELNGKPVGIIAGGPNVAPTMKQIVLAMDARVPDGALAVVRPGKQPVNDQHRAQVRAVVEALVAA